MSEASDSLQVRTDNAEDCIARLRHSGFNGMVFRGERGWLTVIPYAKPGEMLAPCSDSLVEMASALDAPVINYVHHADFGWSFLLAMPDGRSTSFACMWEMLGLEDEMAGPAESLDKGILAEVVAVESVGPILALDPAAALEAGAAEAFAQVLGFPKFRWLSPAYVTDDLGGHHRNGGEEIGRPAAELPTPH